MSSGAVAELGALLRDPGVLQVVEGARAHQGQRESAARLVRLMALAQMVLREVEAEAVLEQVGEEGR